jgi:hypothetical protein
VGELYDVPSGLTFLSRGANYARFGVPAGASSTQDVTFNVGSYDATAANQALEKLAAHGYNTVRIFLNGACATECLGDSSTADDSRTRTSPTSSTSSQRRGRTASR